MKALCIINDLALNHLVRTRLESMGMHIDVALDSTSGLALFKSRQFDFILLSQDLPDFSGLETIEIIATLSRLIPTIILVKPEEERSGIQGMKLGASDYVILDPDGSFLESLPAIIHRALRHHQLIEQKRATELQVRGEGEASSVENPFDLVVTTDSHGIILDASQSHQELLGYDPARLVNESFFNLAHPDDIELVREAVSVCLLTRQHRVFEFRIRTAQGRIIWVQCNGSILLDSAGKSTGGMFSSRDITSSKKAEQELAQSQERFRTLFEDLPVALYCTSLDGQIIDANYTLVRLLRFPDRQTLLLANVNELLVNPAIRQDQVARIQQDDIIINFRMALRRYDQSIVWVKDTARAITDYAGRVLYFEGSLEDITQQIQAETALVETNDELTRMVTELKRRTDETLLLNEMGDVLQSCRDPDQAYYVIADFSSRLFPGTSGEVFILDSIRSSFVCVADWQPSPDTANASSTLKKTRSAPILPEDCWGLRRGKPHIITSNQDLLRCRHVQQGAGEPASFAYMCIPLIAQSNTIGLLHIRIEQDDFPQHFNQLATTVADRGAQALANLNLREELRKQAIQDPLTGLFNRRHLEEMLEKEIASAQMSEQLVTVVMFDIDYFKTYNDRFGHPAGDAMLREISRYLQQHTFSHESPCLYGGDEFFAILPGTTLPEAAARASGWQKEINHITLKYEGQEIGNVTLSIGVASFPENGNSSIEIMKAVDVALYQAKTDGRNRLVIAKTAGIESIGKN